jgi:rubredoxin
MDRFVCQVCEYVYDPEIGDSVGSIPHGVPFEELPVDGVCPQCGAGKDQFVREG